MIKIVAKVVVKEECIEAFQAEARELVEKSRAEAGNISYSLNQNIKEPAQHCFIEIWQDKAALMSHNGSEHFTSIFPKLGAMAAEPMTVDLFTEVV